MSPRGTTTLEPLVVSHVRFVAASTADKRQGLLGWVSLTVGGLLCLEGVAIRRAADGRFVLAFPRRRDNSGHRRYYVRPRDDRARRHIEAAVFHALGLEDVPGRFVTPLLTEGIDE